MELLDYWRVARRSWLVLLASTLAGLGLAAAYSLSQPTVYSATSSAYVVAGTSESTGDALAGSALAKEKAEIYLPLVTSVFNRTGSVSLSISTCMNDSAFPSVPVAPIACSLPRASR